MPMQGIALLPVAGGSNRPPASGSSGTAASIEAVLSREGLKSQGLRSVHPTVRARRAVVRHHDA